MKTNLIILRILRYLFTFVFADLFMFSGFAKADSLDVDLFPLKINLHYRYNVKRNFYYHGGHLVTDSGSVDLITRYYYLADDTLQIWNIEERNQLFHRITIPSYSDTSFIQIDTIFFYLIESLVGNHHLTVPEVKIFHDDLIDWDLRSPWSDISIQRYASTSPIKLIVDDGTGVFVNDTLLYSQDLGLINRTWRTEWVGTGFWNSTLYVEQIGIPIVGILKNKNLPSQSFLKQNYPNPFNPNTTIEYAIPKQSNVTIKVFDLLGREVMTLVNEVKQAGNYKVKFNASNLPSGVYIYRIKAGKFIAVKKLLLLK